MMKLFVNLRLCKRYALYLLLFNPLFFVCCKNNQVSIAGSWIQADFYAYRSEGAIPIGMRYTDNDTIDMFTGFWSAKDTSKQKTYITNFAYYEQQEDSIFYHFSDDNGISYDRSYKISIPSKDTLIFHFEEEGEEPSQTVYIRIANSPCSYQLDSIIAITGSGWGLEAYYFIEKNGGYRWIDYTTDISKEGNLSKEVFAMLERKYNEVDFFNTESTYGCADCLGTRFDFYLSDGRHKQLYFDAYMAPEWITWAYFYQRNVICAIVNHYTL